jgi:hypothetical protein
VADKIDISAVARVVDQASGPIRAIQGAIGRAAQAATSAAASFVRLGTAGAFGGMAQNLRNVGGAAARLGGQIKGFLAPIGAIAGVAGIGGAIAAMKDYISTAASVGKASRRLGISTDALQGFRYAAGSAETADTALKQLQKTLATVSAGGKKVASTATLLGKFGVGAKQIKEGNLEQILPAIAEGFKKNENPVLRARMAIALFGKAGQELIPFLAKGKDGIAALVDEARRLGIIIPPEEIARAEEANKAFRDMNLAFTGLRNVIGAELVPIITPLVKEITEWLVANREWLRININGAIRVLGGVFKTLYTAMKQINWAALFGWLQWGVGLIGGWENAIIALVAVMNAGLIKSVLGIGAAIGKLALSALAFNPLTLAIVALAAGAFLIYRNWDKIGPWFKQQFETIKGVFGRAGAAVKDWAQISAANIKTAFETGGATAGFIAIGDALKTAFTGVYDWLRDGFANIDWAALGATAGQALGQAYAAAWRGVLSLGQWLGDQLVDIDWGTLGETAGRVLGQAIVGALKAAMNLLEWLAGLDWETVGQTAGRLVALAILGTLKATFELGKWLIGLDWGAIVLAIVGFFDSLVRNFFDIGGRLLKGLINGMIDAIPGLRQVTDAIGNVFSLPGRVGEKLFGGATPAAAPGLPALAAAAAPGPNLLQQNAVATAAAPPQRSEIEQRLKVDMSPDLRASLTSERTRGAGNVRSEVDIGHSMEPALGLA